MLWWKGDSESLSALSQVTQLMRGRAGPSDCRTVFLSPITPPLLSWMLGTLNSSQVRTKWLKISLPSWSLSFGPWLHLRGTAETLDHLPHWCLPTSLPTWGWLPRCHYKYTPLGVPSWMKPSGIDPVRGAEGWGYGTRRFKMSHFNADIIWGMPMKLCNKFVFRKQIKCMSIYVFLLQRSHPRKLELGSKWWSRSTLKG